MAVADSVKNIGTDDIQNAAVTNDKLANSAITINGSAISLGGSTTVGGGNTSRNFIINGAMEVAQRGTSHTNGAFAWLLDRFYTYIFGAANRTISQVTDAPTGFKHSIKIARDNGDTGTAGTYFSQPCASDASVGAAGETVTLSFWAKAGANFSSTSSYISVALYSGTGTDETMMLGLTGSVAVIGAVNQAITTSWVRYEFTSGSAVPTDSNQLVFQIIQTPAGTAGADDWWEITGIQVEIGSSATGFVHESFGDTLRKCKRYFESSYPVGTVPGVASFVTGYISKALGGVVTSEIPGPYYTVEKRTAPTVVIYHAVNGTVGQVYRVSDASAQTVSSYAQDNVHGGGYLQLASGAEDSYKYHFSANAELY
mgnify:CR=1 FL=1